MIVTEKSILKKIAVIRGHKGFSQEYVAEKLSIKQSGYGLIENGKRKLTVVMLLQIAMILDVFVIDLITYPLKYDEVKKALPENFDLVESQKETIQSLKSNISLLQDKVEQQKNIISKLEGDDKSQSA